MSSKTISLKDEAYRRLKNLKSDGKSFSDVVIELTEESKKDFSNIKGENFNTSWEKVKESRKRTKEDEKRERLLSGH